MRISYAITVCTEFLEIQRLINFLLKHKRTQDDIVVLFDEANGDKEIEAYLRSHSVNGEFSWYAGKFKRHFADWKNKLTSYCTGDYIFQIDADEIPTKSSDDTIYFPKKEIYWGMGNGPALKEKITQILKQLSPIKNFL